MKKPPANGPRTVLLDQAISSHLRKTNTVQALQAIYCIYIIALCPYFVKFYIAGFTISVKYAAILSFASTLSSSIRKSLASMA